MAQYSKSRNSKQKPQKNDDIFEVNMIATKDGEIVTSDNPFPVTLGSDTITITGNVNVGTTVEISNEEGNPIPTHAHLFDENDSEYSATNPLTIDGTVNIGTMPEVEIKNDSGNPIPVIGTTINPFGKPVVTVDDDTVQHTATNRRKVSNYEITEFNTFQYTKDPLIWDEEITGTASSVLDPYEAIIRMDVGTTAGDKIVRQTKRVIPYIPGRENEVIMSFRLNPQAAGIRQRVGIFEENTGIFLEDDGTDYYLVVRKDTAGGMVETKIARANWNGDKLDGTGGSGITLNWTKFQTMVIEYNWFIGHAEIKLILNNYSHSIHQFEFNNANDSVFTNTPFLPVRWEIENVDGVAGSHRLEVSSYATLSEAGSVPLGVKNTVITPLTGINCSDANTFYPIISVRLRSNRLKGAVLPQSFQVAALDNAPIFYKVLLNPDITGDSDWISYDDTHLEYNVDATGVVDGDYVITSGYISPNGQGAHMHLNQTSALQMGRLSMGDSSEIITIAAASSSANKDVFASFSWIEVR